MSAGVSPGLSSGVAGVPGTAARDRRAATTDAGWRTAVADYATLAKPGITLFIGVTAAAGWVAAAPVRPQMAVALLATMLASAGAAAFNQLLERDADARMRRTAARPMAAGRVSAFHAATFATALSAAGLILAWVTLPVMTLLLLAACHVSYVLIYTPMKRWTPLCTLAGAVPGALPLLAGWTASGAAINGTAVALTAVVYLWQIPHFVAIGWRCREDYARAGFRILGVIDASGSRTAAVSIAFTTVLLPVSLVPVATGALGLAYAAAAVPAGCVYIVLAVLFGRHPTSATAMRLFFGSLAYLPIVLCALMLDRLL